MKRLIIWMLLLFCFAWMTPLTHAAEVRPCVRILYDRSRHPDYHLGKIYSIFLQNLLGHFPHIQQIVQPIETYKKGDLNKCKANFYIGSYFENDVPEHFMHDFVHTYQNVVWMGYTIWKLGNDTLDTLFGYTYDHLTTFDADHVDDAGRPTFYKNILYKDETFIKYGDTNEEGVFLGAYEMIALKKTSDKSQVLAEAIHNHTQEKLPYIIRNKNHFYIADIPMSYMHEADRYLVFTDVLFDILKEEPRHRGKRPAIFRVEDVHPRIDTTLVWNLARVLHQYDIPFHVALIAMFSDPNHIFIPGDDDTSLPAHQSKAFMELIELLKHRGAQYIWHGVTHQYDHRPNPHTGISGEDFEFWDIVNNRPLPDDSVEYVLDRLDDGAKALKSAGLNLEIWEVPHYQASALDYLVFSYVFSWNIGRIMYTPFKAVRPLPPRFPAIWYENAHVTDRGDDVELNLRHDTLSRLHIRQEGNRMEGQFFPFEIYGDVYGQRVLPENLGNPQPYENEHVSRTRTLQDMLQSARRNIKLRDAWGSFFFHPHMMNTTEDGGLAESPGDTRQLRAFLDELIELGYEFINLTEFIKNKKHIMRPKPIVITEGD